MTSSDSPRRDQQASGLVVGRAGPLVTLQDAGRFGRLRFGVPASGPMDRFAHAAANAAIGNDTQATAIEVSLGGVELSCTSQPLTVAVAGGVAVVEFDGERIGPWSALTLRPGQRLAVRPGESGSWSYIAVAGHIVADRWLGSTATHSMSGLGGGLLSAGQTLVVTDPRVEFDREGSFADLVPQRTSATVRVVLGPQRRHFVDDAVKHLCSSTFEVTRQYDRMGMRLAGPDLAIRDALSIPSEPLVRGSIQVAGDGVPTVLFADHQTTGGYPKIATVVSADLDALAQHRPGDLVTFEVVEPQDAVDLVREQVRRVDDALELIGRSGRNLSARLLRHDLIGRSGVAAFDETT